MIINIAGRQVDGRVETRLVDTAWDGRESKAITVPMGYPEAVELFVDATPWSVSVDVEGEDSSARRITSDMSDYAISGPITDNRDGTVTVRMGKYRASELMMIPLAESPADYAQAVALRGIIETAVQTITDDATALTAKALYPAWADLIGKQAAEGMRFRHGGDLYKVTAPHTFAVEWIPGEGTESLYVRIDEAHAGTENDPIPYEGNMALVAGLYYAQDGEVYLCTRDTGNPVYAALDDLVGLYVEMIA